MQRFRLEDFELFLKLFNSASPIFKEPRLRFQRDTFSFHAFDETITSFILCELQPSFFDEYQCDEDVEICIFLTQLLQILKSTNTRGKLNVSLIDNKYFEINLVHEYEKDFKLVTIDYEKEEELKFPIINNDFVINLNSKYFLELIKDIQYVSEYILLESNDDRLKISGKGVYGEANIEISEETSFVRELKIINQINNKYDIKYLYDLVKESADSFDDCTLSIQNKGPLSVSYDIFKKGTLKIMLVPDVY